MCISHTACRGSSMMRSRGCTITATGTMIRCRGGILPGDPIGPVGGGWNPYSYVLNNPAQFIDPTGLTQEDNWTYGEVGNSCVTSQRDFTPPARTCGYESQHWRCLLKKQCFQKLPPRRW